MRKLVASLALALMLAVSFAVPALAATSADVTVTATPTFISISNDLDWTINGISGDSKIDKSTTYYANPLGDTTVPDSPVVDGGCRFTITNTSNVITDLTVNFPNFTGGDAMTNGEAAGNCTPGAGTFCAYSYCTGMTTYASDKVVCKTTGSADMKTSLAATTNIKWGLEVQTQTGDWASATQMSSTVVITATEH